MSQEDADQASHIAFRYETKLAEELADLYSIQRDLADVIAFNEQSLNSHNPTIKSALYIASLIVYRRCFLSGVRNKISLEPLHSQIDNLQEYHEYKINMASKLAAHSVNPFEQNLVGVLVSEETIEGVVCLHMKRVSDMEDENHQFIQYVNKILDQIVIPRIEKIRAALIEEAKATPIDQIISAEELAMTVPGPDAAKKRR